MKTEQFVKRVLYLILNWESDWSFPHVDQFLSNRPAELGIFVYELGEMCLFLKKTLVWATLWWMVKSTLSPGLEHCVSLG